MARMGFDTRSQNAWKELIEKESVTRISWHRKYQPTANTDDEWFKRAFYTQATSKPTSRFLPTIVYPPRPKQHSEAKETFDIDALKEMYPVRKEQQDLLYDGISQEDKGRRRYLTSRQTIPPDQKYQHPIASSMEYGWKFDRNAAHFHTPIHARGKLIEESFYRSNGAFQ